MSEVLDELRKAAGRLIGLGFETLIFAADHGHVLMAECSGSSITGGSA